MPAPQFDPQQGYVPQTQAAQMMAAAQAKRQSDMIAAVLNDETQKAIEAQGGDNIDVSKAVPNAYLGAAKRMSDLGHADIASQLYSKGMDLAQSTAKSKADTRRVNAEASDKEAGPYEFLALSAQQGKYQELMDKFPEGSETRTALKAKSDSLQTRMDKLSNITDGSGNGGPVVAQYYIEKKWAEDHGQTPPSPQQYFADARDTSGPMQMWRNYAQGERAAGREPMPSNVWIPQNAAAIAAGQGIAGAGAKDVSTMYATANIAQNGNSMAGEALAKLNAGIINGTGANLLTGVARFFDTALGRQTNETALSANTDAYIAAQRYAVMAKAKTLGVNPTDTDRQFIEAAIGADPSKTRAALRTMLKMMVEGNNRQIKQYNGFLGGLGDKYEAISGAYPPVPESDLDFGEPEAMAPPKVIRYDITGKRIP